MPTGTMTEQERLCLAELVAGHRSRIRAFLCRFESDPDVIDEITQDVFIGIIPRVTELAERTEEDAAKYLRGVARNTVRLRWRRSSQKNARRIKHVTELVHEHVESRLGQEECDSEAWAAALKGCVEKLSSSARALVQRHYFDGVPLVEIAEAVRRSAESIRMMMLRIRRQLKLCVESQVNEVQV